jgi:phosphoglycolate phosphatase
VNRQGLLLLDLDGTLFHTETVTVPATQRTFQSFGLPVPPAEEICSFFGRPTSAWHAWLRSLCPPGIADQLLAAVDRRELELVSETGELYSGVRQALVELRTLVAQMAICSNGPQGYVERVLATQDLSAFFDVVRFRQADGKDKTGMVGELLGRLAGRPALVVGDRWDDIAAAHENGLPAIAAAYGYGSAEEWSAADAVAHSPAELPALVRKILVVAGQRSTAASAGP